MWSTGSRAWASGVVAHGLSCLEARGIFPAREPVSPALGGGFFNHWATREALHLFFEEFDYSVFGRSLTHSLKIEFLFSIFFCKLGKHQNFS